MSVGCQPWDLVRASRMEMRAAACLRSWGNCCSARRVPSDSTRATEPERAEVSKAIARGTRGMYRRGALSASEARETASEPRGLFGVFGRCLRRVAEDQAGGDEEEGGAVEVELGAGLSDDGGEGAADGLVWGERRGWRDGDEVEG